MLVVDDNATNRRILEEMLASWHMKPVAVADAAPALAGFTSASPTPRALSTSVISDCQMPDVDGFTLARRIKHDRPLCDDADRHADVGRTIRRTSRGAAGSASMPT